MAPYLAADAVVDCAHAEIRSLAGRLVAGCPGDIARAQILFEWVRDSIPHTNDTDREEITCGAVEVLRLGTGLCYAKAHLLAALLRAVGIPAGFCYQVYCEPLHRSDSGLALHGLNGVYLASLERWIRVDPRGNKPGIDAGFDTENESLAFPELAFLDNRIYARPLANVVQALQRWPTKTELWPHLPGPDEMVAA
ncbi:MAG: transglutaminase domain-containing protein [Candidatus Latescibacteria bacterium]|nr:transglutaminase domain-containing protein [Candidatus Latescibacterota bacterium]